MGLQWSWDHFLFTAKKSGTVNDVYFLGPLVLFFAPAPPFLLFPAPLWAPAPAWPAPPRCELLPPAPDSAPLRFGIRTSL